MELCQILCWKSKLTKSIEDAAARQSNPTWLSFLNTDAVGRSWERGTLSLPAFSSQTLFTPGIRDGPDPSSRIPVPSPPGQLLLQESLLETSPRETPACLEKNLADLHTRSFRFFKDSSCERCRLLNLPPRVSCAFTLPPVHNDISSPTSPTSSSQGLSQF